MDESWRMTMGTRTSNRVPAHRRRQSEASLDPDDFNDVFGGPPRTVLARKHSADMSSSEWFYNEVFKHSDSGAPVTWDGHRLPEFVIPEVRRSEEKVNKKKKSWMSKSKSTSSSVLSFEEGFSGFGEPGVVVGDEDVALSSFTSRLRPINVPYRWNSKSTSARPTCKNNKQDLPAFGCNKSTYTDKNQLRGDEHIINSFIFGFPHPVPSHETMVDYHFRPHYYSPSAQSSGRQHHETENMTNFPYQESFSYRKQSDKVDEDYEVMGSSYTIELNSQTTDANNSEAIDIDEAIAWAKEQFHG